MISDPKAAADAIYELLQEKGPTFGLPNIEYDSRLIRSYPACVVVPGRKDKIFHSTGYFLVGLEVLLSIYHAKLTSTHLERTRTDLQMCNDIESSIETGQLTLNDQVVVCYVSEMVPGLITRTKGEQVVGTRMVVTMESRERMSKG